MQLASSVKTLPGQIDIPAKSLANPKHAKRVSDEQRRKIEAEMKRLRKALDALPRSHRSKEVLASDGEAITSGTPPSDGSK